MSDVQKAYEEDRLFNHDMMNQMTTLGASNGIRFDGKNHNWLLFEEYLSLPFCFLTFSFKEKEDQGLSNKLNVFDVEPFNYLFNKMSPFMDGKLLRDNFELLEKVLYNFEARD